MNKEYRYILEKGSKKHLCPNCSKKRFVRYVDTVTGEYLPEQFGRCDREANCPQQEYNNPYKNGYAKAIWEQEQGNKTSWKPQPPIIKKAILKPTPEPIFFDFETFTKTLKPERYEKNTFIQNLFHRVQFPFEINDVEKVIQLYRLGTIANGNRAGANTFPFIDAKGNVRAVQVKQFDEQNHTTGTDFLHSIIEKHHTQNNKALPEWLEAYNKNEKKVSCLFGEHLLISYPNADVFLFEAPKTAIYSTLYFGVPENSNIVCLAVYNKSSFSFDKLKALQGRFVYVFPDLSKEGNTFKEWETKAKEYESRLPLTRFIFSDLLEQLAPERDKSEGKDIADYLIKHDWRNFRMKFNCPPVFDECSEWENIEPIESINNDYLVYVSKTGELFIPTPYNDKTFSVYPSIESYNKRLCLPEFIESTKVKTNEMKTNFINTNTLTIENNLI